jgi:hypothetical protein
MNRSYSKIRHIQESNQRLEKRLLGEQNDLNDYSQNDFSDELENLGYQQDPSFQEHDMTPENFDDAYDEIKGRTFASFGDMGMYVDIYQDYPASDVANSLLKKYPVIETFSSYDDWKDSEYYGDSQLFSTNSRPRISEEQIEESFNDYINKYGDMIIKKGENFNNPSLEYSVNPESNDMSPEERLRHLRQNIQRQMK